MNTDKIKSVLLDHSKAILSMSSFSDRLNKVYEILNKEFPKTSVGAAIYGPMTALGDFLSREEIEPLLYAIKQSAETNQEYTIIDDSQLNSVLEFIYKLVKKKSTK